MRLKGIILENFRCYHQLTMIPIDENLTALIGKNDVGKSTILEALEIFFNNKMVKMQRNDASVQSKSSDVLIGCIFDNLPIEIVLDSSSKTDLATEHLLNKEGDLVIHKVFDCELKTPKETVHAYADHPTREQLNDLLLLKISELKQRRNKLGITSDVDLRSSAAIRQDIWSQFTLEELDLQEQRIQLDKEDAKTIWIRLSKKLPTFALFQSDRPSTDEDSEVQDPMKLAVDEAIKSVEEELESIKRAVQQKATEVANKTLDKLKEMDATLANELVPDFRSEPRWSSLFKLTLTSDDQIPINKRGSGVRRLILLNFFRAQAEARQHHAGAPGIIYAIEEPETSQHPKNQKLLLGALSDLSVRGDCQVLLTTHVPGLAGYIPVESLRYIQRDSGGQIQIRLGSEDVYEQIAQDLGVLPNSKIQVLVCVEGPNDVAFLAHISRTLHAASSTLPSLADDPRIAILPLGGSTLKQWVEGHYLRGLGRPEIHIYDNDVGKYQDYVDEVNSRSDGSWATLTGKREMENYLHPDAIQEVYGITVTFTDGDDVPLTVAKMVHSSDPSSQPWVNLNEKQMGKKVSRVKRRLNHEVTPKMTISRIRAIDTDDDIGKWLQRIADLFT